MLLARRPRCECPSASASGTECSESPRGIWPPADPHLSQGLYEYLQPSGTPSRESFLGESLNYDTFGLAVSPSLPSEPETGLR